MMAATFVYLSIALWFASCAAWIWSAFARFPVQIDPKGIDDSIVISDDGPMLINGMKWPNASDFETYQRKLFVRNAVAAGLSAAAALFTFLNILLQS